MIQAFRNKIYEAVQLSDFIGECESCSLYLKAGTFLHKLGRVQMEMDCI